MRYILIDKVTEFEKSSFAIGFKQTDLSDEIFLDHFPGFPVFPGAMIIEACAQLSGFLLEMSSNKAESPPKRAMLVQIEKSKFLKPIWGGEKIVVKSILENLIETGGRTYNEVFVGENKVAVSFLQFKFQMLNQEVLHIHRQDLYKKWTIGLNQNLVIK